MTICMATPAAPWPCSPSRRIGPKGLGVQLEKASGRYFLLKDGEEEREIGRAEAWQLDLRDVFRGGISCRSTPG